MWTILVIVIAGNVDGGVSALQLGSYNSAEVCQKIAIGIEQRGPISSIGGKKLFAQCVQIRDKPSQDKP